jgi:predicted RNA binding protein YcfA (HicA-like mRNA interferase family)
MSGRQALRALELGGFVVDWVQGSHHIMRHPVTGRRVSVPVHGGHDLKVGTLRSIIRDAELTVDQFCELLK